MNPTHNQEVVIVNVNTGKETTCYIWNYEPIPNTIEIYTRKSDWHRYVGNKGKFIQDQISTVKALE